MKLKDILNEQTSPEDANINDWIRKEVVYAAHTGDDVENPYAMNGVITCREAFNHEGEDGYGMELQFQALSRKATWHPPIDNINRAFAEVDTLTLENYTLNDLTRIGNGVQFLSIDSCDVKSLKGASNLKHLKELTFNEKVFTESNAFGMLSLLKAPKIYRVYIHPTSVDDKWSKLIEIINSHLKTKDIADCMDALIDAGFKEYAKL
jgi:hypothetical protein